MIISLQNLPKFWGLLPSKDGYFLSLSTIIDTTKANTATISPEKLIISCNASNTDKSLPLS
jgi:hypothetical protein